MMPLLCELAITFRVPMLPTVFVERIKDLREHVVTLTQREIAKVNHKYLVEQGLKHEVQPNERFAPVVTCGGRRFWMSEAGRK